MCCRITVMRPLGSTQSRASTVLWTAWLAQKNRMYFLIVCPNSWLEAYWRHIPLWSRHSALTRRAVDPSWALARTEFHSNLNLVYWSSLGTVRPQNQHWYHKVHITPPILKGISFTSFVCKIKVITILCIMTNQRLYFSHLFPMMSLYFELLANV